MATGEEAVRGEGAAQGSQGKQEQQATAVSIGDQKGKRGKWRWERECGGKWRGGEGRGVTGEKGAKREGQREEKTVAAEKGSKGEGWGREREEGGKGKGRGKEGKEMES